MPEDDAEGQEGPALQENPPAEHRPKGSERSSGTMIHLGGHHRLEAEGHDVGELAPYSKTASGLSALGRAQARAHAISEHPADAPVEGIAGGRQDPGPAAPRATAKARTAGPRPRRMPRRSRARPRGLHHSRSSGRLLRVAFRLALAGAAVVVLGGVFVAVQLGRSVPRPVLQAALPATASVTGPVPTLPWPPSGEAAVAVTGVGVVGSSGGSTPVPIASLAKVMTAVVVLHDHPLAPGQSGPKVAITAADQATYEADNAVGDSVAPVIAGESLSELQLLDALLVPSADNLAPVLARWDAGSEPAFVAKMNTTAAALHLGATHYTDANGVSPTTVSTAADQLHLAQVAAADPVLMSIVAQPLVTLPNSPPLSNYDTLLGHDGIVGIKTGSTTAAGGCFMFAADASAAGRHVQILGVVLGQSATPLIPAALAASRALIGPVLAGLHPVTVLRAGTSVAQISARWGTTIPVTTTRAVTVLHFGQTAVGVAIAAQPGSLTAPLPAGVRVATVTVDGGGQVQTVPAVTTEPIRGPSLRWRLERL